MGRRTLVALLGAISGVLCVVFGAFGAHGLTDPHARDLVETAGRYHSFHTMALFLIVTMDGWGAPRSYVAAPFFAAGLVLFCGGLYAIAFGAAPTLGMIVPIGGLAFIIGWCVIGWAALQIPKAKA